MGTILLFLIILTALVLVHELGHFLTARFFGMKVLEFGVGFPPRAFGWYKDPKTGKRVFVWPKKKTPGLQDTVGGGAREEEVPGVLYTVNWLPIGGFVKIKGENGGDEKTNDSFAAAPVWKRLIVLVAGVVMNIILASLLFGIGFMKGLPTDVSGGIPEGSSLVGAPMIVVQEVVSDSPAEKAGVKPGDKIVRINTFVPPNAAAMSESVLLNGEKPLTLELSREEGLVVVEVIPGVVESAGETSPKLGVRLADVGLVQFAWYKAIPEGFVAAFWSLLGIFQALWLLVVNLVTGKGLLFEVSGPVGIATAVGQSAELGISYLIHIAAMISLSLAAMNILPIPALDGGRAFFVALEGIFRRKIPPAFEGVAHTIGFVLLMILIMVVTGRDILKLFS